MFNLKPKTKNLSLAIRGEKAAQFYIKKLGYTVLETNYCNTSGRRIGEIDIIAKDKEEIVFIEVKTCENSQYQQKFPEENITKDKLYKLSKIASFYVLNKKRLPIIMKL